MVRRRHGDAGRDQARARLRRGLGPGYPLRRRHPPGARHKGHRRLGPGLAGARADPGRAAGERLARLQGGRRHDRALPRRLLVSRRPARTPEAHQGRGTGRRRRTAPPGAPAASAPARPRAGRQEAPALQDCRHPVSGADRDPAHDRLRHHGLGQDGADLGPGGPDQGTGRALRDLRQDGELHRDLPRSGPRRADEPARRQGAPMVALPGSAGAARLRHDGRGADPAAEGHGGPVLGDGGAPALRQRRGACCARRG